MYIMGNSVGMFGQSRHIDPAEAANRKQYIQWDIALRGFDNPYPLDMVTDPFSNHFDVLRSDEVNFVENHQICKADLAQLEQV